MELVAEATITVGTPSAVEGRSPGQPYCVMFEDDGDTGCLYALDLQRKDNPIVDALQIYNAANVADREEPSLVQLAWSDDGLKAALLINGCFHAVFDFLARRGYCRTGSPPPDKRWTELSHEWSDAAVELFH